MFDTFFYIKREDKTSNQVNDIILLYSLVFLSVFVVYFTNNYILIIYFLVLLLLFWYSRFDYFWIAFILIIGSNFGSLFPNLLKSGYKGLPLYTLGPGFSFSFFDLFNIIALIKIIRKRNWFGIFLKKPLYIIFGYILIMFLVSIPMGLGEFSDISYALRQLFGYSGFFVLPALIKNKDNLNRFIVILFPSIILVLITQMFHLVEGVELGMYLRGEKYEFIDEITELSGGIRSRGAPFLSYFIFVFGLISLSSLKPKKFEAFIIKIFITISVITILLPATRGWIIAIAIVFILYNFFVTKNVFEIVLSLFLPILLFLIVVLFLPSVSLQIESSLKRLSSLEYLVQGDETAGGTLKRIDLRSPVVLNKFSENPIIGWGFSKDFFRYNDGHVGNQNILLNSGIIGFGIIIYFWIYYLTYLLKIINSSTAGSDLKEILKIHIFGFIGLLFIHSTSTQIFGFVAGGAHWVMGLYFCAAEIFIKKK